jgi:hypothetical protein
VNICISSLLRYQLALYIVCGRGLVAVAVELDGDLRPALGREMLLNDTDYGDDGLVTALANDDFSGCGLDGNVLGGEDLEQRLNERASLGAVAGRDSKLARGDSNGGHVSLLDNEANDNLEIDGSAPGY